MAGPLPKEDKRRRNAPTIPTTSLPVSGRKGRPPAVPGGIELGKAGAAWWKWAWTTPQACAWDKGSMFTIVRRAQLEDDLDALNVDASEWTVQIADFLGVPADEKIKDIAFTFGLIKRQAGGSIQVMKEMRELDNKLGLSPKALADLRWKIVKDAEDGEKSASKSASKSKGKSGSRRDRLTLVK